MIDNYRLAIGALQFFRLVRSMEHVAAKRVQAPPIHCALRGQIISSRYHIVMILTRKKYCVYVVNCYLLCRHSQFSHTNDQCYSLTTNHILVQWLQHLSFNIVPIGCSFFRSFSCCFYIAFDYTKIFQCKKSK